MSIFAKEIITSDKKNKMLSIKIFLKIELKNKNE
jgi:hypothetical protein